MGRIRPLTLEDVTQVAVLHRRVFGDGETDCEDIGERESYLRRVFLDGAESDPAIASRVFEEEGRIVGFMGVVPREMSFSGNSVLAAVSSQFIVDPESRSRMVGVQLLKDFFEGPQDLSIADEANDAGRKLWEGLGGATARLYSFYWTRPLRPSQYAVSLLRGRKGWTRCAVAARPVAAVLDAIAAKFTLRPLRRPRTEASGEVISEERLWSYLPEFAGERSLRPDYDMAALKSVLERAEARQGCGAFQRIAVRNSKHDIVGWYLYYLNPGGIGEVLQMAAKPKSNQVVLDHLLHHAWRGGAAALSGRLQPGWMQVLSENYCFFHGGPWVLVASKRADLLQTFHEGSAFFSRCEGEWCLRYR
ncbi:MAG: GNAT family N-acetyltransferase [Terriglobia bacterium]